VQPLPWGSLSLLEVSAAPMRRARGAREVLVGLPLVFAMLQSLSTAHVRPGGTETALPWTDGRSVGRMRSPPASSLRLRGGTSAAEVDGRADAAPDEAGGSGTRTKEAKSGTIKGTDKSRERRAGRKNTRIAGATAEKHPSASAVLVSKSTAAQSETAGSNPEAALPEPEGAGQAAAPAEDEEAKRKREKRKRDKMKKKQRNKIQKQTKVPFRPWIDKPAPGEALAPDLSVYDCWFPLKVKPAETQAAACVCVHVSAQAYIWAKSAGSCVWCFDMCDAATDRSSGRR
jgi:hypothetical protein